MNEIIVNSTLCDYIIRIKCEKSGDKIITDIETTCDKIKEMSHMEVPIMEILDIKENYVVNRARERGCCSSCIVPLGIIHGCKIEAGFIAESLAKRAGSVSIEFR